MTLSLKQRAEEIARDAVCLNLNAKSCSDSLCKKLRQEILPSIRESLEEFKKEVREETIRECADLVEEFGPYLTIDDIAAKILSLLPPPKTGKP